MKIFLVTSAIAMVLATSGWSAGKIGAMDVNADGVLTIDEVRAALPEVTVEAFSAMDVNADGTLDEDEVGAAQDAGLMPTTEG